MKPLFIKCKDNYINLNNVMNVKYDHLDVLVYYISGDVSRYDLNYKEFEDFKRSFEDAMVQNK